MRRKEAKGLSGTPGPLETRKRWTQALGKETVNHYGAGLVPTPRPQRRDGPRHEDTIPKTCGLEAATHATPWRAPAGDEGTHSLPGPS